MHWRNMKQPDVFFFEAFEEEVPALQRHLDPAWRVEFTPHTIQEYEASGGAPPAPVISIRTQSVIPPAWAARLRGIQTRATGYDHILVFQRVAANPPPCGSLPKYCGRAVAEHAAMMWLALLRRLPRQIAQFDRFHRDGLTGRETQYKTLLVAGAGDIGGHVANIGRGLDMNVIASDIVQRHAKLRYVSLDEGIQTADVIVCAMNLTGENIGLFSHDRLRHARPGCIFINVSRGEISPPEDLEQLLEENILGGVGLDVFEDEPQLALALRQERESDPPQMAAIRELRERDNVILTPHNAFNTLESTERKSLESARELTYFFKTGRFATPVSPH